MNKTQNSYDKFKEAFHQLCEEMDTLYLGDKATSQLLQRFTQDLTPHKNNRLKNADKIGTNLAVEAQLRKLELAITELHPSVYYFLSKRIDALIEEKESNATRLIKAAQKKSTLRHKIEEKKSPEAQVVKTDIDWGRVERALRDIQTADGMLPVFVEAVEKARADATHINKQTFRKTICNPEFWAVRNALFWIRNDYCANARPFKKRQLYISPSARSGFAFRAIALLFEHAGDKKSIRQIEPLIKRALIDSPTLKN